MGKLLETWTRSRIGLGKRLIVVGCASIGFLKVGFRPRLSRRGTLSFNWRMLLVPPSAMDYLIYHELAHLEEMNHSIRFWRLVRMLCPTYAEAEHWLKKNGRLFFLVSDST